MQDLARWADGRYRIAGEPARDADDTSDSAEASNPKSE
jgi:endogenous inhibitor of DNA gyrase (YacG/DUF329 family)